MSISSGTADASSACGTGAAADISGLSVIKNEPLKVTMRLNHDRIFAFHRHEIIVSRSEELTKKQ